MVGGSLLQEIDTRNNPNLKVFMYLAGNAEHFDFSQNPQLQSIWISGTPMTSLDVSANKNLTQLWCHTTNLSTIDLTGFPNLNGANVNLSGNRMISIHTDISNASQMNMQNQRAYTVRIPQNQTTYDLHSLDPNIDPAAIIPNGSANIQNAVIQDVKPGTSISYDYKVGTSQFTASIVFEEENSWIQPLNIQDWTYGQTPSTPSAQAAFGEVSFTYSASQEGPFESEVPADAGTWYVKATVPSDGIHIGLEDVREFTIHKAKPAITIPAHLSGWQDDKLDTVVLPEGFAWKDPDQTLKETGTFWFEATYTPEDTQNYLILEDVSILVEVKEKETEPVIPGEEEDKDPEPDIPNEGEETDPEPDIPEQDEEKDPGQESTPDGSDPDLSDDPTAAHASSSNKETTPSTAWKTSAAGWLMTGAVSLAGVLWILRRKH